MADGITQPGGGANPILFQNNADPAAGGDGSYSFADISAVFPALCIDLGTTPKSYRLTVSLTNGDGVGTTTTTLKDADCFVVFDAGRTYSVSATGRSNRFTELGTLVDGTKDSARQGVSIVFGATVNMQGNAKLYGCSLKATTGNITLAPAQTGLVYQVINCILYAVTGSVALGIAASGNADIIYNVDVTGGSAAVGAISNFGATSAERLTVAANPACIYHVRTNSVFDVKDFVLVGAGAGTGAQLRLGGNPVNIVAPVWDQNIPIVDGTNSTGDEWWPYDVNVTDGNADAIAGLSYTVSSAVAGQIINATTNASGRIVYGSGATANCIKVVAFGVSGSRVYQGPWTARINQSPVNPNYPQRTIVFDWPVTATWLTNNNQYQDMFDIIQLVPPGGTPTGWVELSM